MEWIKIGEQTTIPDIEVLALREDTEEMMMGYLLEQEDETVNCEDEYSILEGVTHFIYKTDFLNLLNSGKLTNWG